MKRLSITLKSIHGLRLLSFILVIFTFGNTLYSEPATAESGTPNASTNSVHCGEFTSSPYFRRSPKTSSATPANWTQVIENAQPYDEILLADGLYPLEQYAVVLNQPITLRSASGNRQAVIIEGKGYNVDAEALMVMADDVHIADLTVRNVRDHAISLQEGFARTVIYNVDLIDIGTQHIKGNRMGPDGVIACSQIGYTQAGAVGDYNSAIDLHGAIDWSIRDNTIYNIYGDGSGCIVDTECGTVHPGGEPAILLWRGSRDNHIERNNIVESYRGISLGLDTIYTGGTVKDNFICRSNTGKEGLGGFIPGDAGISLLGASNVTIEGNTLDLPGEYPGQIEIRDGSGMIIKNNAMSKAIWNRGNAEYNGCQHSDCDDQKFGNTIDMKTSSIACPSIEALVLGALPTEEEKLTLKERKLAALEFKLIARDYKLATKEQQLQHWRDRLVLNRKLDEFELQLRTTHMEIDFMKQELESIHKINQYSF